jgi:hypothetical protein
MFRIIALSLVMLFSIGALLPFAGSSAHGLRQNFISKRQFSHLRHSRAWWRRYRARLKRRRAAAAMAHRKVTFAPVLPQPLATGSATPVNPQLPTGWTKLSATNSSEMKFRTETTTGTVAGQASLAVVAQARPNPAYLSVREERRLLAGVAIGDLRRIVIDKMLADGGWVTNDFTRDVAGQRVFIVTAQTPAEGRSLEKSWNFYFTEVNGRIYSLTTNTPPQFAERMAEEAQRFISSFGAISKPASK